MKPTQQLHDLGQSLWLDNITRTMLARRHARRLHRRALGHRADLEPDDLRQGDLRRRRLRRADRRGRPRGRVDRGALLRAGDRRPARRGRPLPRRPRADRRRRRLLLARGLAAARRRHRGDDRAGGASCTRKGERDNLFIKIPGTTAGLPAIEESIFAGIPINVTLLFDAEQYLAAADAYMKGVERRIEAGLDPDGRLGRLDLHEPLGRRRRGRGAGGARNRLGLAVGFRAYRAYRELLDSPRWQRLMNEGARPQRLLWASTGTKDPEASDVLYIEGFASPFTINTMPEPTLLAFADHGEVGEPVPADGGDADEMLAEFESAGIGVEALAARLQGEGSDAFDKSWDEMLESIETRAREGRGVGVSVAAAPTLREGPAWRALEDHFSAIRRRAPARPLRGRPRARRAARRRRRRACTSTTPRTGSPTRR